MPKRIQLSRKKGWRKPEGAIVVSRPSKWGNGFRAFRITTGLYTVCAPDGPKETDPCFETYSAAREHATFCFRRALVDGWLPFTAKDIRRELKGKDIRRELKGKDLCCWCPLPQPGQPDHCHAAVLLEIANADPTEESGER